MTTFDYETKVWGAPEIKPTPFYIQGLKLKYFLKDLRGRYGRVLDIGGGAGNMAKAVKKARPDLEVVVVDISHAALSAGKKQAQGVKFKFGSAEKLPFKNNSFDVVSMFDVLEHVNDIKALKEVKRVLKSKGMFHLFLPLDNEPGTIYYVIRKLGWQPKDTHTGHVKVYNDQDVEDLANKLGFKLIKKRFSFHYFFSIFDIAYFSLLEILHLHAPASIEGMIESKKHNPLVVIFNWFYRAVVIVGNIESMLLKHIPGGGGHFTFIKN